MARKTTSVEVKDGVVSTDPADFAAAIDLIRRDQLPGLWVRSDFNDKNPKAPIVDLALLKGVPWLVDFGIADISFKRVAGFETIYDLKNLTKLALHTFKSLDLGRFKKLETLFVTDAPGLTGLAQLSELRYARISRLRTEDLSFLAKMRHLSEMWIIQAAGKGLDGVDSSPSLVTLDISHCAKLERINALPQGLVKLRIKKCPRLHDLSFVTAHPSLEFLYIDVMPDVAFAPTLPKLTYAGFENVLDGNLESLLESKSLRDVGFYPAKRRHYSRSEGELKTLLAERGK